MTTNVSTPRLELLLGDCREVLRGLPAKSVQCVVTSPPYWGLRSYGLDPRCWGGGETCDHSWGVMERGKRKDILPADVSASAGRVGTSWAQQGAATDGGRFCTNCGAWRGCLGNEPTPELYTAHLVEVFREVRRVLRDDGTLWLNLGDSYAGSGKGLMGDGTARAGSKQATNKGSVGLPANAANTGLAPKNLIGIPWRVAFALQADGWYLRSDIIWAKPNPMPESIRDRPTKAHEYLFLLAKSERYYYDRESILEPLKSGPSDLRKLAEGKLRIGGKNRVAEDGFLAASKHTNVGRMRAVGSLRGRNKRSVWTVSPSQFKGAHFATFPAKLIEPCILAGAPAGATVLDPFCGAATTLVVARDHGRAGLGIDANPDYLAMARTRLGLTDAQAARAA